MHTDTHTHTGKQRYDTVNAKRVYNKFELEYASKLQLLIIRLRDNSRMI